MTSVIINNEYNLLRFVIEPVAMDSLWLPIISIVTPLFLIISANSVDPDQTPRSSASGLRLQGWPRSFLGCAKYKCVLKSFINYCKMKQNSRWSHIASYFIKKQKNKKTMLIGHESS